jgi:hypothetical protein
MPLPLECAAVDTDHQTPEACVAAILELLASSHS